MRVGVPKETAEGERRVALVPEVVRKLSPRSSRSRSSPAPASAMLPDALFEEAGATLGDDAWGADVVTKVAPPSRGDRARLGQRAASASSAR